jgi:hypothetical protein
VGIAAALARLLGLCITGRWLGQVCRAVVFAGSVTSGFLRRLRRRCAGCLALIRLVHSAIFDSDTTSGPS